MQGKRVYKQNNEFPSNPGEYMKNPDESWVFCVPTGIHGTINSKTWAITEHEDKTITVSPSILVTCHNPEYSWHGFLEKGIWREC